MQKVLSDAQITAIADDCHILKDAPTSLIIHFAREIERVTLWNEPVKQAVEDSKRLQWFIDNEGTIQHYTNGKHQVFWGTNDETTWYDNPRDAIDEARKDSDAS
jgi:hypothetical protein